MGVQKRARCIVGEDYPEPVVDHIEQRRICVERLNDMCISLDISGMSVDLTTKRFGKGFCLTSSVKIASTMVSLQQDLIVLDC